ncbi:hypothetical protein GGF32_002179 [Allomyces javanicus]|nr:hypothetical protein GGF32_002179 [Allomyces javanicus]
MPAPARGPLPRRGPPLDFDARDWHGGRLAIELGGHVHPVKFFVHRSTAVTWAHLCYQFPERQFKSPAGYWFFIDQWANTTGMDDMAVRSYAVDDPYAVIDHLRFQHAYLEHVGVPEGFNPDYVSPYDLHRKEQIEVIGRERGMYWYPKGAQPDYSEPIAKLYGAQPELDELQRIKMAGYSLARVLEWIECLWTQYPTQAPAIALYHSVEIWPLRHVTTGTSFAMHVFRIACDCIVDSRMAPPVRPDFARLRLPPNPLDDAGLFDRIAQFEPDDVNEYMARAMRRAESECADRNGKPIQDKQVNWEELEGKRRQVMHGRVEYFVVD